MGPGHARPRRYRLCNKSIFKELTPLKKIAYDHVSSPGFVATIEFEDMGEQTLMNWRMLFETPEQCVQIVEVYGAGEGLTQTIERLNQYVKR